jgi:hypothetical protein
MLNIQVRLRVLVILGAGLLLLALGLFSPANLQAHPQYGLTPTPTSPPGGPTPTPKPPDEDEDDFFIEVQLPTCDLSCNFDQVVEIRANVQLIHEGSGWIAEATLSNLGNAQIRVPYEGEYKVWLISSPEVSGTPIDPATGQGSELIYPDSLPALLGTVYTTSGTQTVECPLICPEVPLDLPTTGWQTTLGIQTILAIISATLILIMVSAAFRGKFELRKRQ